MNDMYKVLDAIKAMKTLGAADSIQLSRAYNANHKTALNWHEFSDLLDYMNTLGMVKVSGFGRDGQTVYTYLG